MTILYLILLVVLMFIFPTFRCIVFHPFKAAYYAIVDSFFYIVRHKRDLCEYGYIKAYTGLFGKGKTLSAVHFVVGQYNRYNNKRVWCSRRKKFVTQKIKVISNVQLNIPYEEFVSLKQFIYVAENSQRIDDLNDTLTVTIILGDEFSVQLNSRSFKSNIDALFLNSLLTCRHYYIGFVYTAQRYCQVDALLRQVTSVVIECNKFLRFQKLSYYDAWDLENAGSPMMVKPMRCSCWFVRNKDYNAYDTFATVGNLSKACATGDMLTGEEILALQCNNGVNMDAVSKPSRRYRRSRRTK